MKRSSSSVIKTKLYGANQIQPISYLQYEYFKPKQDTPSHNGELLNTSPSTYIEHKLLANKSYIGGKGGDLYTRTRNCLYQNNTTSNVIYTPNVNNMPLTQKKPSIPKKSNLDKLLSSLKNEILEISKNIQTTPSVPHEHHDYNNNNLITFDTNENRHYSKSLGNQRISGSGSNDKLLKSRPPLLDIGDNYDLSRQRKRYSSNNNCIYTEETKKSLSNCNTYNYNSNNNSTTVNAKAHTQKAMMANPPMSYTPSNHSSNHYMDRDDSDLKISSLVDKNKQLEQLVTALESKLNASNGIIPELIEKANKYEKRIEELSLENKLIKSNENNDKEDNMIQPYPPNSTSQRKQQKEITQYKSRINDLIEENKRLGESHKKNSMAYIEEINQLKNQSNKNGTDLSEKDDEISQLNSLIITLKNENEKLKESLLQQKNDYDKLLVTMEENTKGKEQEMMRIKTELTNSSQNSNSNTTIINQMGIKITTLTNQTDNLQSQLKEKSEQYDTLQYDYDIMKNDYNQLKSDYEELTHEKMKKDKDFNQEVMNKLKQSIETLKNNNMSMKNEHQKELKETQKTIDDLNKQSMMDKNTIKQLNDDKNKFEEANKSNSQVIDELKIECSILREEKNNAQGIVNAKELESIQKLEVIQSKHDKAIEELKSLKEENNNIVLKEKDYDDIIKKHLETITIANDKIKDLHNTNELLIQEANDSKEQHKYKDTQIKELITKLISTDQIYQEKLTKLSSNTANLHNNQLKDKETIQYQLNEISLAFTTYKNKYTHTQNDIDQIQEPMIIQKKQIDSMSKTKEDDDIIISTFKGKVNELNKTNSAILSELDILKKNNNDNINKITDLNKQLHIYQTQLTEKDVQNTNEKNDLQKDYDELLFKYQMIEKEAEELNIVYLKEKDNLALKVKIINDHEKTIEDIQEQLKEKEAKDNDQSMELTSLTNQIKKAKIENEGVIQHLNSNLQEKVSQIAQMHMALIELNQINEDLNKKILSMSTDDPLAISSYRNTQDAEEVDSLYKMISQCKDTIILMENQLQDKDSLLNEKDKELDQFKEINKRLLISIESLKVKNENKEAKGHKKSECSNPLTEEGEEEIEDEIDSDLIENLKMTIDNLRELVTEKDKQLTELIATQKESNCNVSYGKISNMSMADAEKCEQYRKRLEDYKAQLQSEIQQNSLLKEDIKDLNRRVVIMQSFEGKIASYEEFIQLWMIAFDGHKPKNSEKKEAFYRIQEHLTGYDANISQELRGENEKKGIFNKLFK